jgi:uncharacterized protein with von Willebrand factor type A (vWA) domain
MRSSNKSRSRNRNHNHNSNRRSNSANVVNRVFDSNGPESKVRGTPQQIVDKYQALAQDATLAGDRVNAENFLQHSEHYSRLLSEAQREIDERREAQEAQRQQQQQQQQKQQNKQQNQEPVAESNDIQPDIAGDTAKLFPAQAENANLVDTPESKPARARVKKPANKEKTAQKIELAEAEAEKPAKSTNPETAAE